jgi:CelD/BcsL family acetyltransferase involved in cellulose biosynthesis
MTLHETLKSDYRLTRENFESLASIWRESPNAPMWSYIFVLPPYLETWWNAFGCEATPYLGAVRQGERVIGIAPLLLRGDVASFLGSTDVCDYLDFVIVPGREADFFHVLLSDLKERNIDRLDLKPVRPESTVLTHLVTMARNLDYDVSVSVEDTSQELDLPPTWEGYLETLTQKQRHEVRRKLRRLGEAGVVHYRVIADEEAALRSFTGFLKLFRESRQDKASFLTPRMESFFASLVETMGHEGLLKLGILDLDTSPVAAVMYFDYRNKIFLYNNGYDPEYSSLSVGLISKVLCIKDSLEKGRSAFDFLKGAEEYKHRLGGREVPLYACRISL